MLGDQAHQRDQADLRVDIERAPRPLQGPERAHHGKRHRQHDDKGIDEALKLRGQHQEDEQQRQRKHHGQRTAGRLELPAHAVELGGVAGLEHLGGGGFQEVEGFTQRVIGRQVGGDGDRSPLVEVVELPRTDRFLDLHQRRQRHHGVTAPADKQALDVLGRGPPAGSHLHEHVVLVSVSLVAGHGPSTQHGLHHARHLIDADPCIGGAVPVDFKEDLRLVEPQVDIGRHQPRVLGQLSQEGLRHARQVLVAVTGDDDEVHGAVSEALPQAGRRDGERHDARQAADLALQLARDLQRGLLALAPVHRPQDG